MIFLRRIHTSATYQTCPPGSRAGGGKGEEEAIWPPEARAYQPPGPSMGHRLTPEYRSRSTRGQLHGELHSQLTVNSQSTQRSTGPQNPGVLLRILEDSGHQDHQKTLFNLIKIIKRGRSPHPSSLSGLMTTPFLQLRNVNPGFGCPVDR